MPSQLLFLRRPLPFVLATSWAALAPFTAQAGRPADQTPPAASDTEAATLFAKADSAQLNPPAVESAGPTRNVVINLINRLVDRGLLPKEDAVELIHQAEADAAQSRAQAETTAGNVAQVAALAQAAAQVAAEAVAAPASDDDVRVTYIPDVVKAQLREQIKADVMAQAKNENWAAPRTAAEWTQRIRVFGDVRGRYDNIRFPEGNDNTGAFPNFNAINTGGPFDVSGTVFSPQNNVDQNRQRFRLRARLGVDVDLRENFSAGIRIATGDSNTPVSTNQSIGLANQSQGGNFSKYALWLDRAFLKYEVGGHPGRNLALLAGRFDNPYFSPSEIVWDDDVGFDGAAIAAKYQLAKWFTPFITGGAFPVFNTDLNFSTNQPAKFKSTDKWLYGGQLGFDLKPQRKIDVKLAGAYYHFDGVEGRLSDPFTPLTASDQGNTDNTRPSFAQKGNTYMALRNIVPNALNDFGTSKQYQYFGLATPFHELVLNGKVDYTGFEPVVITGFGEFAKNLAFDRAAVNAKAVNNRGTNSVDGTTGAFDGGDTAWIAGVKVGAGSFQKRWDWSLGANYRYVESDAVVDGFTDSDFGLGGTNMKGYTLFGSVALSQAVTLGVRWMSANEVAGPPQKVDIFQVDLSGKF
ncbi:MAG: putative porin [Chthoniobacteraceae bacterium]